MSERKLATLPEEKLKRIAVAMTVAGALLVLFLVVILIIQFVQIGVANSEAKRLKDAIAKYEELSEIEETKLDFYETEDGLYYLAMKDYWN